MFISFPIRLWLGGWVSPILLGRRSSVGDCVLCESTNVTTKHIRLIDHASKWLVNLASFVCDGDQYLKSRASARWSLVRSLVKEITVYTANET